MGRYSRSPSRQWLIPNWLPANTVTMFTGQGGAGKSWLTLQVACEIASNAASSSWSKPTAKIPDPPAEYDNTTDNEPKHIVFATYEDEPAEIKRRLNALASTFDWIADQHDTIKKHLHIVDMRGIGSVWGPGAGNHIAITGELLRRGEELRSVCENIEARLLILDPLSGAFGGNENDRTAVYDFVSSFRGWGDEAKCAMLVIGHLPKTEGVQFSGSTAWEASARAMWLLGTKDEKLPKMKQKGKQKKHRRESILHCSTPRATTQRHKAIYCSARTQHGWWEHCQPVNEACEAYTTYADISLRPTGDTKHMKKNSKIDQTFKELQEATQASEILSLIPLVQHGITRRQRRRMSNAIAERHRYRVFIRTRASGTR